jgi:SAM-dependent methyltransferase
MSLLANNMSRKNIVTGRPIWLQSIIDLFPKNLRLYTNPRRRYIELFVQRFSKKTLQNSKVLDAGAGPCPYKKFFNHTKYEATDFSDPYKILNFVCNLEKIPKPSSYYDLIVSTEVLEHVENPENVIKEFYRILKPTGKLFLTTPQQFMIHQAPYNFFYFTKYGLESLLKKSGFKKFKVSPMGGYFSALADMIKFNGLLNNKTPKIISYPLKIIGFPFTQIIFPLILSSLDFLDKNKEWTMGYTVEATK